MGKIPITPVIFNCMHDKRWKQNDSMTTVITDILQLHIYIDNAYNIPNCNHVQRKWRGRQSNLKKKNSICDNKVHIELHVMVKMRKAQFLIFIVYLAFNKHSMDESGGGVSPLPIILHSYCVSCYFLSTTPKSCFKPPLYSNCLLSSKRLPPPTSKNYTVSLRVIVNSCKDIVCLYKVVGPKLLILYI